MKFCPPEIFGWLRPCDPPNKFKKLYHHHFVHLCNSRALDMNNIIVLNQPALGVSVKSVYLVAGRLGFSSRSGHTKDF